MNCDDIKNKIMDGVEFPYAPSLNDIKTMVKNIGDFREISNYRIGVMDKEILSQMYPELEMEAFAHLVEQVGNFSDSDVIIHNFRGDYNGINLKKESDIKKCCLLLETMLMEL